MEQPLFWQSTSATADGCPPSYFRRALLRRRRYANVKLPLRRSYCATRLKWLDSADGALGRAFFHSCGPGIRL
eukprot:scaffold22014_cov123-Isochrysis_galbana.AAC.3